MMSEAERREATRLKPQKLTFVALRPEFSKLGKIVDISQSGLCFQYMTKQSREKSPDDFNIDMFVSENGYYLPGISCQMVYDKGSSEAMTFPNGLEYRRCGLRFVNLTKDQADRLDMYLENHTAGMA
jgi:hypothetical protein